LRKKSFLMVILSTVLISAMLFSATPIGIIPVSAQLPAQCPELHLQAEAETYANGDHHFAEGYYDPVAGYTHAECSSHWSYQGYCLSLVLSAISDVYVYEDAQGVWGPCQVGLGRLSVGASMIYCPPPDFPSLEAYTEARYYSDGAPFLMNCPLSSHIFWITGGSVSCTGGMMVEDETGIIYDVAVKVGAHGFRVIENVGTWPKPWQVESFPLGDGRMVIFATLAPYQFNVPVTGCARATFYLTLTYTRPLHESSLSGSDAAEITNGESKVEDRYEATFNVPSVGGIQIPVDKLGLLSPYIALASATIIAAAAIAIYFRRVKHRKEVQ